MNITIHVVENSETNKLTSRGKRNKDEYSIVLQKETKAVKVCI